MLPTMDSAHPRPSEGFRRFEDLTRRLANVSKGELDAEREAEKESPDGW